MTQYIQDQFESMMEAAGFQSCSAVQRLEMQRAFFGGSVATMALLASEVDQGELLDELRAFNARQSKETQRAPQSKSWPFGTRRQARVMAVEFTASGTRALALLDELAEGHLLIGDGGDAAIAGQNGTIVFTRGGPRGGYWKFEAGPKA